jgi:hypothetical protein
MRRSRFISGDLEEDAAIELSGRDSTAVLLGTAIAKDSRSYWSSHHREWASLFRNIFQDRDTSQSDVSTNSGGCSFTWDDAKEAGAADVTMGVGTAIGGSVAWMLHIITRAAATGAAVTASITASIHNAGMKH